MKRFLNLLEQDDSARKEAALKRGAEYFSRDFTSTIEKLANE